MLLNICTMQRIRQTLIKIYLFSHSLVNKVPSHVASLEMSLSLCCALNNLFSINGHKNQIYFFHTPQHLYTYNLLLLSLRPPFLALAVIVRIRLLRNLAQNHHCLYVLPWLKACHRSEIQSDAFSPTLSAWPKPVLSQGTHDTCQFKSYARPRCSFEVWYFPLRSGVNLFLKPWRKARYS